MASSLGARPLPSGPLIDSLSSLLTEMCVVNDQARQLCALPLTKFHSVCAPQISIREYLNRIRRYSTCSPCCFVLSLIYMDRAQACVGLVVDSLNVHRLLITSIMLASKFFDDKIQRNSVYAQIGGVVLSELNRLEVELLNSLQFSLDVVPADYNRYEQALVARFAVVSPPLSVPSPTTPPVSALCVSPLPTYTVTSVPAEVIASQLAASYAPPPPSDIAASASASPPHVDWTSSPELSSASSCSGASGSGLDLTSPEASLMVVATRSVSNTSSNVNGGMDCDESAMYAPADALQQQQLTAQAMCIPRQPTYLPSFPNVVPTLPQYPSQDFFVQAHPYMSSANPWGFVQQMPQYGLPFTHPVQLPGC